MKKINIAAILVTSSLFFGLPTISYAADQAKTETAGQYVDDATITTKVKAALLNEPNMNSSNINVETYKGVVQISGFVANKSIKNRAEELAKSVSGVKKVENDIRLK